MSRRDFAPEDIGELMMFRTVLSLALTALSSACAHAEGVPNRYPEKPVRLLVGFGAGGPSDIVARAFADQAAKSLGQAMVVENKPGANAVLATEAAAQSPADGLTLLAAATNHTMIPALYAGRIKFDAATSFAPICTLASSATVLVVGPSLPVKSVGEFLTRARAKPGALTYASPGLGSSPHLATETFSKLSGTTMTHIPYKGAAAAVTDLIGGQVDLSFATVGSVLPHLKTGRLTALAVAAPQRSALLPQVPTFEEAGVKNFAIDTWYGLLAPAGTPAAVLRRLGKEAQEFGRSALVRERLISAGLEPSTLCGEAFATQIRREIAANTRLARELNLSAD
jgi:tripartite-type tricarboxylate transporter receptor subunit TctC